MRLSLALLGLLAGCYYDVPPDDADLGALDMAAPAPPDFYSTDGIVCPNGSAPLHRGELTEAPTDEWAAVSSIMPSVTTVTPDTSRVAAGTESLRLDTTVGQAGLIYPGTRDGQFDLSTQLFVSFSVTADDSSAANDPGWQGTQPHLLIVTSSTDYYEYVPDTNRLPRTPGTFVALTVPLAGGDGWTRTQNGTPDLSSVKYFGWLFQTFGAGFTAWLDDVQIGPSPFLDCAN